MSYNNRDKEHIPIHIIKLTNNVDPEPFIKRYHKKLLALQLGKLYQ